MPTEPIPVGEKGEVRCFCSRSPLLAVFGVGRNGGLFIHVKVWKQNRLYAELVISGKHAETSIKCRDCYRWYTIFITDSNVTKIKEVPASEVQNGDSPSVDSEL